MKKNITLILLITNAAFAFTSCMAPKPLASKFNLEQRKGRDTSNEIFIVKRDGEKITGKKLTSNHPSWFLHTAYQTQEAVAIDGQTVNFSDYELVQTNKAYRVFYQPEKNDSNAEGTYINRLRFGRLNLYHYEVAVPRKFNYQTVRYTHKYVYQIGHGKLCPLDYASFEKAISDNKEAVKKLGQLFPSGDMFNEDKMYTLNSLLEITDMYNTGYATNNIVTAGY